MRKTIYGHEFHRKSLFRLIQQKRLPSVLLFSGERGIGKSLVAKEVARQLLCQTNVGDSLGKVPCSCENCRKFDGSAVPDLHYIDISDRDQSNVEALRELLYTLNLKSFNSSARVVIFDNAEELTPQATNILLKTLEEPRPGMFFVLITTNHTRLLPTLVSRCQVWHFSPLESKDLKLALLALAPENLPTGVTTDDLMSLCDGSLARIGEISSNVENWRSIVRDISAIIEGDTPTAFRLADQIAKNKEALRINLRLISSALHHLLLSAKTAEKLSRIATAITNLLTAEQLALGRNVSPAALLNFVLVQALPTQQSGAFTTLTNSASLLEHDLPF